MAPVTRLNWNRPQRVARRGTFKARRSSWCRLCREIITPGQTATYFNNHVVHRSCVE